MLRKNKSALVGSLLANAFNRMETRNKKVSTRTIITANKKGEGCTFEPLHILAKYEIVTCELYDMRTL